MGGRKATVAEVRAAVETLAAAGVSQAALARTLGRRAQTVTEWLGGEVSQPNVEATRLAQAVAELTGSVTPAFDVRSYTAELLVGIEDDATAILRRIAEAREALGLPQGAQRLDEDGGADSSQQPSPRGPKRPPDKPTTRVDAHAVGTAIRETTAPKALKGAGRKAADGRRRG